MENQKKYKYEFLKSDVKPISIQKDQQVCIIELVIRRNRETGATFKNVVMTTGWMSARGFVENKINSKISFLNDLKAEDFDRIKEFYLKNT